MCTTKCECQPMFSFSLSKVCELINMSQSLSQCSKQESVLRNETIKFTLSSHVALFIDQGRQFSAHLGGGRNKFSTSDQHAPIPLQMQAWFVSTKWGSRAALVAPICFFLALQLSPIPQPKTFFHRFAKRKEMSFHLLSLKWSKKANMFFTSKTILQCIHHGLKSLPAHFAKATFFRNVFKKNSCFS